MLNASHITICQQCGAVRDEGLIVRITRTMKTSGYQNHQEKHRRRFSLALLSVLVLSLLSVLPISVHAGVIPTNTDNSTHQTSVKNKIQNSVVLIEPKGNSPPEPVPPPKQEVQSAAEGNTNSDGSAAVGTNDFKNNSTKEPAFAFDENAVKRTFLVLAGLGAILLAYFGIKFACVKKRKTGASGSNSRYGLVESSEMDLLENIEEDDEDEEDNTLFDLHSHRRT